MGKIYPAVVMIKKHLIWFISLALLILLILFLVNIYYSSHEQAEINNINKDTKVVSSAAAPDWYQNQEVRKPNNPVKASTATKPMQPDSPKQPAVLDKVEQTNQPMTEEMKKIMGAPISSNQISTPVVDNMAAKSLLPQSATNNEGSQHTSDDQNMQVEKKTFLKTNSAAEADYLQEGLKNPISPYEVKAGTIIPALLITGINSDLPGQITAQVRSNVYDTISGKYLLVPQGAKLTGLYDSQVAYGQSRILVVWKRIIYPNGQNINLEGMPGVDMTGYAGFHDQVNNHYMKIFGSVILMSAISAGAQLSQPRNDNNNNNNPTINQTLAASLGTNIMNSANMLLQKNLGVQPTLVIRPGYLMNVSVTKDIVFPGAYKDVTNYGN